MLEEESKGYLILGAKQFYSSQLLNTEQSVAPELQKALVAIGAKVREVMELKVRAHGRNLYFNSSLILLLGVGSQK